MKYLILAIMPVVISCGAPSADQSAEAPTPTPTVDAFIVANAPIAPTSTPTPIPTPTGTQLATWTPTMTPTSTPTPVPLHCSWNGIAVNCNDGSTLNLPAMFAADYSVDDCTTSTCSIVVQTVLGTGNVCVSIKFKLNGGSTYIETFTQCGTSVAAGVLE